MGGVPQAGAGQPAPVPFPVRAAGPRQQPEGIKNLASPVDHRCDVHVAAADRVMHVVPQIGLEVGAAGAISPDHP